MYNAGADLGLLAGEGVSRSHMSFYLRTRGGGRGRGGGGAGRATHVSFYLHKGFSRLLIVQSLHRH